MIVLDRFWFSYATDRQGDWVMADASIKMETGGVSALVGVSGVGKSTLLALLAGILVESDQIVGTYSGKISIDGAAPERLRGVGKTSWMPQQSVLLDHLTVAENVTLPFDLTHGVGAFEKEANILLGELGLTCKRDARPRELSGGQQTRVSLARALIGQPKYLFLDEPFGSLDLCNRRSVYAMLLKARRVRDRVTIIATHNVPEAMLLANRIVIMKSKDNRTVMKKYENPPIDFELGFDEVLAKARSRARKFEAKIC